MIKLQKQLFRDSSVLILAQSFTKVVGFFYNIFLAKYLGVGGFGEYVFAISVFGLLSSIADLGMNQWLVRQVALDEKNRARSLEVLVGRYVVVGITLLVMVVYLMLVGDIGSRGLYILLAGMAMLPQMLGITMDAVAVGLRRFYVSAMSLTILSLAQIGLGIALTWRWGIVGSLVAFLLAQMVYAMLLVILLQTVKFRVKMTRGGIWSVVKGSVPFGMLVLIGVAYARLDAILLGVLRGSYEVGIYGAGYKFFEAVSVIPSATGAVLYPYFVRLYQKNRDDMFGEFVKIVLGLMVISAPIIASYWLIVPLIIKSVLPGYIGSIEVIKVLSLGVPFYFGHNVVSVYLLSRGYGMSRIVVLSFVVLMVNGVLNYVFIPKFGYMASAWAGVGSEFLALVAYFSYAKLPKNEVNKT